MNNQDYWLKKHQKYTSQDWIRLPTIFATQVIEYFPKTVKILELGCGQGQDSIYFAQQGFEVAATDFSQFAIDQAKSNTPADLKNKISYKLTDLSIPLTFSPESFDIVYSHLAVHYFDKNRTQQLFDEIYSILKPSGLFVTLLNTLDDPEVGESQLVEKDLYITPSGLQKRFFSTETMKELTSQFEILLLDNRGETHKDAIKTLVRFIGRKPKQSQI